MFLKGECGILEKSEYTILFMRIRVKVVPRSSKKGVEPQADGSLIVRLSAPPVEGKANEQLIELVAKHCGVAKSLVRIVNGTSSRVKTLEITEK